MARRIARILGIYLLALLTARRANQQKWSLKQRRDEPEAMNNPSAGALAPAQLITDCIGKAIKHS